MQQKNQADPRWQAKSDGALLAGLGIGPAELAAIKSQGFIHGETLPSGRTVWKLRYRVSGSVRVRYLGVDAERVGRIREALARWQQGHRQELALAQLTRGVGQLLRAGKRRLEPDLVPAGFHFHGLSIRKIRSAGPRAIPSQERRRDC